MALQTFKGSFTAVTSGSQPAISGLGFSPKAIIFWSTGQTATGFANGASTGLGCATSPTQRWTVAVEADDATANADTGSTVASTSCLRLIVTDTSEGASHTLDAELDLQSIDSDGFTVVWDDFPASAVLVHYFAIGGSDITNAKAGVVGTVAGTGSESYTDPGFQPDIILLAGTRGIAPDLSEHAMFNLGAARTSSEEAVFSFKSIDAATVSTCLRFQVTTACMMGWASGTGTAEDMLADFTSFDANGWTVNYSNSFSTAISVCYLALKGGQYKVGVETAATSVTTKATNVGFTPTGLLMWGGGAVASASIVTSEANRLLQFNLGASDGTNEGCSSYLDEDAATTMDTYRRFVTTKAISACNPADGTVHGEADCDGTGGSGFTGNTFVLNWTDADSVASEFIYLAMGSEPSTEVFVGPRTEYLQAVGRSSLW